MTILPSVSLSEEYDSNVFRVNRSLSGDPGAKTGDFLTTLAPNVIASNDFDFGKANLFTNASFTSYAKNTELNYVGFNAGLNLKLNKLVQKLDPNAGLQVFQGVTYTPTLPSFLGPSNSSSDGADVNQASDQSAIIRGFVGGRQSSLVLTTSVAASERLTQRTTLLINYQYNKATFLGSKISSSAPQNFDTSFHLATGGIGHQVTINDRASIFYSYGRTVYASDGGQTGANRPDFESHGAGLSWYHAFSPSWNGSVTGGASLQQPTNQLTQTYNANLFYRGQRSTAAMSYSRAITPSFVGVAGALVSDVALVTFSYKLGALLSGGAGAAYSNNEFVTTIKGTVRSYGGNAYLVYMPAPWMITSLNYGYNFFDQDAVTTRNTFDQHTVTLNLIFGAPRALLGAGGASGL